jgi:hypothetical protein
MDKHLRGKLRIFGVVFNLRVKRGCSTMKSGGKRCEESVVLLQHQVQ